MSRAEVRRRIDQQRHSLTRYWRDLYKMSFGCQYTYPDGRVCGWAEHPAGLTFDHQDGKSMYMTRTKTIVRALREIRQHNCQVLCANHHNVKTFEERQPCLVATLDSSSIQPILNGSECDGLAIKVRATPILTVALCAA